jgi:AcrR family transcriptional regulator
VFVEQGFVDASIAEVVRRADSSVGSLYHHFGGKNELFVALWQEHQAAHEIAASKAVAQARQAGVTDPFELISAGARAFFEGGWQRRDLAMLFLNGDGPPGFEIMKRRRGHEWMTQNGTLLRLPGTASDRLYASILTSLIGEGARAVAAASTRQEANEVIDVVIECLRRIMLGSPWRPPPPSRRAQPRSAPSPGT